MSLEDVVLVKDITYSTESKSNRLYGTAIAETPPRTAVAKVKREMTRIMLGKSYFLDESGSCEPEK